MQNSNISPLCPFSDLSKPKTEEYIFGKHYYPQPLKPCIIYGIIGATRLKSARVGRSLALKAMLLNALQRYIDVICKISKQTCYNI